VSVLSGLEKLRAESVKIKNYLAMCDKHVFGKIAKMPVGDINATLVSKLKADKEELALLQTKLTAAGEHIDTCLTRAEQVMADKGDEAAAPAPAKPAKTAAKPAGKKKPAKGAKAAKPKVKAKRPGAATAAV
jgi:DNA replication initiation complex subunit (GINS family)